MKKAAFIIVFLIFITSSHTAKQKTINTIHLVSNSEREIVQGNKKIKMTDSLYFTTHFFNLLYKYILKNGKVETVKVSSKSDVDMDISQYVLRYKKWELVLDSGVNVIYFKTQLPEYNNRYNIGKISMKSADVLEIAASDSTDKKRIHEVYCEILKKVVKKRSS